MTNDIVKQKFGERLKQIRKINNLTQEKLAEYIEINPRQLARIEAGESFVTSETLAKIASTFDIYLSVLFDFGVQEETLKTGTGDKVHFNVIKNGNVYHLVNQSETIKQSENTQLSSNLDESMIKMAQRIGKEITVDELNNGSVVSTKIYKPNGQVELSSDKINVLFESVKEKLSLIAEENNKLEFVNLALDALNDKNALENLKLLMKGIELSHTFKDV
ncbi:helix-turn-helix transcriptional regulator [bacterium]|nr:helix-turn-helix transcriptional regulator [bacterium]